MDRQLHCEIQVRIVPKGLLVSQDNGGREPDEFTDSRPCMAFDAGKEVSVVIDSLHAYRIDHAWNDKVLDEYIRVLADEFEVVLTMFNKKEK